MKNKLIIPIAASVISFTFACNGDHSTRVVRDTTAKADVHADPSLKNPPSNLDTAKVTTTTGDASTIDNGGSGGTKIDKDTAGIKAKPKN